MKRLLFIFSFSSCVFIGGQKIEVRKEGDFKVLPKIDSTKNLSEYRKSSQFLGIRGSEIYAYPLNNNYDYSSDFNVKFKTSKKIKDKFGTHQPGDFIDLGKDEYIRKISGNYFIVQDVEFYKTISKISPEEWDIENKSSLNQGSTKIFVTTEDKNDVYIFEGNFGSLDKFLSMPFLEFLKRRYIGKTILYDKYRTFKIQDNPTYEASPPNYENKFIYKIKDISIIQSNSNYSRIPDIFLIAENENDILKLPYKPERFLDMEFYTLQKEYDQYILNYNTLNKKKLDDYLVEQNQEMLKYRTEKEIIDKEKLKKLSKKYGDPVAKRLVNNEVWIGMSRQMLIDSRGEPTKIGLTTETQYTYSTQYIYNSYWGTDYIYLENGKVVAIQNY